MVLLVLRVLLRLLLQVTRVVGAIPGMWGMVHGPRQVWNLPKLSHPPSELYALLPGKHAWRTHSFQPKPYEIQCTVNFQEVP